MRAACKHATRNLSVLGDKAVNSMRLRDTVRARSENRHTAHNAPMPEKQVSGIPRGSGQSALLLTTCRLFWPGPPGAGEQRLRRPAAVLRPRRKCLPRRLALPVSRQCAVQGVRAADRCTRILSCISSRGARPLLVFHRDDDYWHKPAQLPRADWVSSFEVRTVSSRADARALARRFVAHGLRRRTVSRANKFRSCRGQSRSPAGAAGIPAGRQNALRTCGDARPPTCWALRATWPRPTPLRPTARSSTSHSLSSRHRTARTGITVQPNYRPQRRRSRVALPGAGAPAPGAAAFPVDRRRRGIRRLCQRHHSYLCGSARRFRGLDRRPWTAATGTLRHDARWRRLARYSPASYRESARCWSMQACSLQPR